MRLRPTGRSGSLVIPLAEFVRYYQEGNAQVWERQALTRARVVHGDAVFGAAVLEAVWQGINARPWRSDMADDVLHMRRRLEASRSERDLKRGFGGIVDVEFLVQLYQLKYSRNLPDIRRPNVWDALDELLAAKLLKPADHAELRANYEFLRRIESRLRIVYNFSQDELPQRAEDLVKLARRLGYESDTPTGAAEQFLKDMEKRTARTREIFLKALASERS
jgi:glutamate-ammonia-ligase adenylyltransferase